VSTYRILAPATVGNIGPGFDVLGLALEGIGDEIALTLVKGDSRIKQVSGRDAEKVPLDPKRNAAAIAASAYLQSKSIDAGVEISLVRQLPISGGLGSSAASSVGGALAAALAAQVPFDDHDILIAALAGEEAVAGRHLDNIAPCYFGGITIAQRIAPPKIQRFNPPHPYYLAIATPKMELKTKSSRGVLPESLATAQWTTQMAMAIGLAVGLATANNTMIKESLVDTFAEPRRRELIPGFDLVKTRALESGALGCSISGAGPSVFALAADPNSAEIIAEEMKKAFLPLESSTLVAPIAARGAYLI
jgi:homoserine kinase